MKYKVIAQIKDGAICATKGRITCYVENSLDVPELKIGDILPKDATIWAETYWSYSRKEWEKMNEEFNKLKLI